MRVGELDFIRGFALLTITVNHYSWFCQKLGYQGLSIPTLTHWGYSSAAELFFMTSGYLVGLIYFGAHRPFLPFKSSSRLLGRSLFLVCMNALLFVAICALLCSEPDNVVEALLASGVANDPFLWAFELLQLGLHLPLLGILNVYVVLLVVAVPFGLVMVRDVRVAVAMAIAIYIGSQFLPELAPKGGNLAGTGAWSFNPFAWQILFTLGMAAGRFSLHEWLRTRIQDGAFARRTMVPAAALYLFLFLLFLLDRKMNVLSVGIADKRQLEPLRLLHGLLSYFLILSMLFRFSAFSKTMLFRVVANIGENSLIAFVISVLLSYLMAILWAGSPSMGTYFLFGLAGLAVMFAAGQLLHFYGLAKSGVIDARNAERQAKCLSSHPSR